MKTKKSAFTIVELLVVMAVIGILITLSIAGIQQVQKSTRVSKANNIALLVKAQLESYYNEFRQYPSDLGFDTTNQKVYLCSVGLNCGSATDQNVFSAVQIDQFGLAGITFYIRPPLGGGSITTEFGCVAEVSNNTINPDNWKLNYSPNSATRPQDYYLSTCTEFGWKDFSPNPIPGDAIGGGIPHI